MYKFTNNMVAYSDSLKEEYLKAGYKLVTKPVNKENKDDNKTNDGTIEGKPKENNNISKQI